MNQANALAGQPAPGLVHLRPHQSGHFDISGNGERLARKAAPLDEGDIRRTGLLPIAPDLDLVVPGPLPHRALPAGDGNGEVQRTRAQLVQRRPVQVFAGVDIHVLLQQVEARGGRHDFDGRHEGEIGDGAVAGDEEDHIAAAGHLPGDAFQVVAGAVHKIEAAAGHELAVFDDVMQRHIGMALGRRAQRLEIDIVKSAEFIAAGGIALGRLPVPADPLFEALDLAEEVSAPARAARSCPARRTRRRSARQSRPG